MEKTRHFIVDTPVGQLAIYAKHDKTDCAADYPGVFIDYVRKEFSEPAVDAKASYSFVASFAWSAYSCLIGGYPQNSPSECLTLSEACAEDGVSVMIQTSEPGICFEEHITCDDTGTVEHTEKDLLAYKCRHCGEITSFASFEDPDDQECPECGNCGFDRCEEV